MGVLSLALCCSCEREKQMYHHGRNVLPKIQILFGGEVEDSISIDVIQLFVLKRSNFIYLVMSDFLFLNFFIVVLECT